MALTFDVCRALVPRGTKGAGSSCKASYLLVEGAAWTVNVLFLPGNQDESFLLSMKTKHCFLKNFKETTQHLFH